MSQYGRFLSFVVATTIGIGSGESLVCPVSSTPMSNLCRSVYLQTRSHGAQRKEGHIKKVSCNLCRTFGATGSQMTASKSIRSRARQLLSSQRVISKLSCQRLHLRPQTAERSNALLHLHPRTCRLDRVERKCLENHELDDIIDDLLFWLE